MMRLKHVLILALLFTLVGCAKRPGPLNWKPDPSVGLISIDVEATERAELRDALLTLRRVHFSFDSTSLNAESRLALVEARQKLGDKPHIQVFIEGHADERGGTEYNIGLGEARAIVVADYLAALGVDKGRLHTLSFGEEIPLVAGHEESAWAKNRRVDFRIMQGEIEIVAEAGARVATR